MNGVNAFSPPFVLKSQNRNTVMYAEPASSDFKINTQIDLESKKVVNTIEMSENEKKVFCRCWLSSTFPMCDGSHQKHNDKSGDNVGPLIISTKEKNT